jgi:hypothetical protein
MKITSLITVAVLLFSNNCIAAINSEEGAPSSTPQPVTKTSWPNTADELLRLGGVDFVTPSTRRRVDFKKKTYQIFGTRISGLCISGERQVVISKVSDYEVWVDAPPKFDNDPDRKGMCQGTVIKIDTQKQTFSYYEYHNRPGIDSVLTGPYKWISLSFAQ